MPARASRNEGLFDQLLRRWLGLILIAALIVPLCFCAFIRLVQGGATSGRIAKYEFTLHENIIVASVAWSPDGRYIADSAFYGDEIHLWDVESRKLIAKVHRKSTLGSEGELSWSPDGMLLPVCDYQGQIRVYAPPDLREVKFIQQANKKSCDKTAFSSDGSRWTGLGITSQTLVTYSTKDWQLIKSYEAGIADVLCDQLRMYLVHPLWQSAEASSSIEAISISQTASFGCWSPKMMCRVEKYRSIGTTPWAYPAT
jgi:WD40 repeat protein